VGTHVRVAGHLRCVDAWCTDDERLWEFAEVSRSTTLPIDVGLPGRVWKEALTNVEKYAHASVATVRVQRNGSRLVQQASQTRRSPTRAFARDHGPECQVTR
jgi:hypothetical protein